MSKILTYNEAAHKLRMTPTLLKWFTGWAPRRDGRKLLEVRPGEFLESELDAFDAHLRQDWGNDYKPVGIRQEIGKEAKGTCGLCENACDKLDAAHIDRKGSEVDYYFQHPHNLLLVCRNCHGRYDDPKLKGLTHQVVRQAKTNRLNALMSSVDADVARARSVEEGVEAIKREARERFSLLASQPDTLLWHLAPGDLLRATGSSVDLGTLLSLSADAALRHASGSLSNEPVTAAVLDGYAAEASGEDGYKPGSEWQFIDAQPDEGYCWCGEISELAEYSCEDCGHTGFNVDPPVAVVANSAGFNVPVYEDQRMDREELRCEKCGSTHIACSFNEYCSRCEYKRPKD